MNRREMLKVLGAAVAVASLPFSIPEAAKLKTHEFYSDKDAAFVVMDAPHDVKAGHLVMWDKKPLGVACDNARRGKRVLVQVYGEARVAAA